MSHLLISQIWLASTGQSWLWSATAKEDLVERMENYWWPRLVSDGEEVWFTAGKKGVIPSMPSRPPVESDWFLSAR